MYSFHSCDAAQSGRAFTLYIRTCKRTRKKRNVRETVVYKLRWQSETHQILYGPVTLYAQYSRRHRSNDKTWPGWREAMQSSSTIENWFFCRYIPTPSPPPTASTVTGVVKTSPLRCARESFACPSPQIKPNGIISS